MSTISKSNKGFALFPVLIVLFLGLALGFALGKKTSSAALPIQPTNPPVTSNLPTSSPHFAVEPNNSFSQATPLPPGIDTQGTLSPENNIDFYSFTIDRPAKVRFVLNNLPEEYDFLVYDPHKKLIASTHRQGFLSTESIVAIQEKGTYYIKMSGKSSNTNTLPYTIRLAIIPFFE